MGATEITRTAFDRVQRDLGCEFMDWEGWYWPSHFGDPVAEHHAVRNDVGVWDASPLRKWGFSGADALAAADRVFTNDMLGLESGQVRYAPFCDENGKMVGDGTVFKLDDENCIVVTALDSDLDHFHSVVAGLDVEIDADDRGDCRRSASTARGRGSSCSRSAKRTSPRSATSASGRSRWRSAVFPAGCRAPATRVSSASSCSARRTTPSSSGRLSSAPARGRTGSPPSRRSGSSQG